MFLYSACKKTREIRITLATTENKKKVLKLNERDHAILRTLGETPSFQGVQDAQVETPIEATVAEKVSPIGMEQSQAIPIGQASEVTKAINSGENDYNCLDRNFIDI